MVKKKKCMVSVGVDITNSAGVSLGFWCELLEGHKGMHEHTTKINW